MTIVRTMQYAVLLFKKCAGTDDWELFFLFLLEREAIFISIEEVLRCYCSSISPK